MSALLLLLTIGCTPRDTGASPPKDSPVDTGTTDSPGETAETDETSETAETADTAETGHTGETDDSDTGEDTAPPPCDRTLGWSHVACGLYQTCGIHTDGCAECWGRGEEEDTGGYDTGGRYHWYGEDQPPAGTYVALAMNASPIGPETPNACGILDDGSGVCWGSNRLGVNDVPEGTFIELAVWDEGAYGVGSDHVVQQWGYGYPPEGTFTSVATGEHSVVFLQEDGQLDQLSISGRTQETAPPGTYVDIGMSDWYGCAIATDGSILCWHTTDPENAEYEHLTTDAPIGDWVDVCNIVGAACALDRAGTAACWDSTSPEIIPPSDEIFTKIACGAAHICGVTVDNRIVCWGWDVYGETTPPT